MQEEDQNHIKEPKLEPNQEPNKETKAKTWRNYNLTGYDAVLLETEYNKWRRPLLGQYSPCPKRHLVLGNSQSKMATIAIIDRCWWLVDLFCPLIEAPPKKMATVAVVPPRATIMPLAVLINCESCVCFLLYSRDCAYGFCFSGFSYRQSANMKKNMVEHEPAEKRTYNRYLCACVFGSSFVFAFVCCPSFGFGSCIWFLSLLLFLFWVLALVLVNVCLFCLGSGSSSCILFRMLSLFWFWF